MKKPIKFALIQSGYAVFGAGNTKHAALLDACRSLEPDQDSGFVRYTPRLITETLITNDRVDGAFRVIDCDDTEFDSYLKNQGGFIKKRKNWYSQ